MIKEVVLYENLRSAKRNSNYHDANGYKVTTFLFTVSIRNVSVILFTNSQIKHYSNQKLPVSYHKNLDNSLELVLN